MLKNNKNPVCSVIIHTKKTPLMILKRCIDSVRRQTYPYMEIILLNANDADSPFKSAILADAEYFSGVVRIDEPEDHEFTHGKIRALERSTGEYIIFLGAQDIMPETRVEAAINAFRENRDACMFYTDMTVQQNNILEQTDYSLVSDKFHYLSQIIFHRDCFHMIGSFDDNLIAHGDEDLWYRIQFLKMQHHLSSRETLICVCPDAYEEYTPLDSAIGYRQITVKYADYMKRNKELKKELYYKVADSYQKGGIWMRQWQFRIKAYFTGHIGRRKERR